ncbi:MULTISPECIES: tyrosine-type recombinase/integrase [unclassified Endozoicomonas]|uniref:tyrosine-type recombinase/integrase n=1 Tax=unclassified Endozoicomonas TaxID=2644528 RepID=UPI003BB6DB69
MGRPRKKENAQLPDGVYRSKGRFIYKPYHGRVGKKNVFGAEIVLGPETMAMSKLYMAIENLEKSSDQTLGWLLDEYLESKKFKSQNKDWQYNKRLYTPKIKKFPVEGYGTFGNVPLTLITPPSLNRFYEKYSDKPGAVAIVRKLISSPWSWGRSHLEGVPPNPSLDCEALPRPNRQDVYVSDEDCACVYYLANPFWKAMMEFAYICRARRSELINMQRDQLLEKGVQLKRGKGSLDEITLWTPRLRKTLKLLEDYSNGEKFEYVFGAPEVTGKKGIPMRPGQKMHKNTLDSQWQKLINRAVNEGLINEKWHFHDLKAKGVSDHEGLVSGHKTLEAKKIYIRKIQEVQGTR